eukprot:gene8379-7684_t
MLPAVALLAWAAARPGGAADTITPWPTPPAADGPDWSPTRNILTSENLMMYWFLQPRPGTNLRQANLT